jgi:hypothetical protein
MTVEELLRRLEAVRRTSRGFVARCPAHADRHPSLSISKGERGILIKCWSGCEFREITDALGLRVSDLFFDKPLNRRQRIEAKGQRNWIRFNQALREEVLGLTIDALRTADYLISSRHGLDISVWHEAKLEKEMNVLADAYQLLDWEAIDG